MIDTAFAHYRIVSKLGAGGMGEVYRAHDSKLNRDVAIKVLPPALALDADHLARFTASDYPATRVSTSGTASGEMR